ncbi:MAG: HD domain-containing protein [Nitrospirota bacterium]|nr:HD domain-containing protein [Nitrospirota bacterium]
MLPPYVFAYAETLRAEPAVLELARLATHAGTPLWVTGGTLRDALLTRWPADLDLAVDGDTASLGQALAKAGHGTYVPLDPDTGTVRVALKSTQGIDWIDLVQIRGDSLQTDLALRDFTINAIALPLEALIGDGPDTFIDPTGGRPDLHAQTVRMVSEAVLDDDPLRVLRAYRFAAVLGFELDAATRTACAARAASLSRVAIERIRQEFSKLICAPRPAPVLAMMMEDGLLDVIAPELTACRNVDQNHFHHLNVWEHSLETVEQLSRLVTDPGVLSDTDSLPWLHRPELREALFWAALFHDVGKPVCRTVEGERVRFLGHDKAGAELFDAIGPRLCLPGKLTRRVRGLIRHHLRPLHLMAEHHAGNLTRRAVAHLYRDLKGDVPGLFLLSRADLAATRGPAHQPESGSWLRALQQEVEAIYRDQVAPAEATPPLFTGNDLINGFGVPEGPRVGKLLGSLRRAQIAGEVTSREQAEAWLRDRLAQGHMNA